MDKVLKLEQANKQLKQESKELNKQLDALVEEQQQNLL